MLGVTPTLDTSVGVSSTHGVCRMFIVLVDFTQKIWSKPEAHVVVAKVCRCYWRQYSLPVSTEMANAPMQIDLYVLCN